MGGRRGNVLTSSGAHATRPIPLGCQPTRRRVVSTLALSSPAPTAAQDHCSSRTPLRQPPLLTSAVSPLAEAQAGRTSSRRHSNDPDARWSLKSRTVSFAPSPIFSNSASSLTIRWMCPASDGAADRTSQPPISRARKPGFVVRRRPSK
eukprot:scaffold33811_cov84-Isochrysis_galbana.AAC.1